MIELVELIVDMGAQAELMTSTGTGWRRELTTQEIFEKGKEMQITRDMFDHCRQQTKFCEILSDLDVSDDEQFDLFDTLDADGSNSIDLEELIDGISKLRGDARRSDVVALNFVLKNVQSDMKQFFEEQQKAIRVLLKDVR